MRQAHRGHPLLFALILATLMAALGLLVLGQSDALTADKSIYLPGEEVQLRISHPLGNVQLFVSFGGRVYQYADLQSETIRFTPSQAGSYTATLYEEGKGVLDTVEFTVATAVHVAEEGPQIDCCTLMVSNTSYTVGDTVLMEAPQAQLLSIVFRNRTFLSEPMEGVFRFVPLEAGEYRIVAHFNGSVVEKTFTVLPAQLPPESVVVPPAKQEREPDAPVSGAAERLVLREPSGDRQRVKLQLGNADFFVRVADLVTASEHYDAELLPEGMSVKRIAFRNLDLSREVSIGLMEKKGHIASGSLHFGKVYAIDPTGLRFSDAVVTATAQGRSLYKCRDWDFESERCLGSWEKMMDLVPGGEYSFTLTADDPGFAETGVATVNTDKPMYHPGGDVSLVMAVLDSQGHLVSGASLVLNVTLPDGSSVVLSTSADIVEREQGIYDALFTDTSLPGTYGLAVTALGPEVDYTFSSFFEVRDYYEYDIIRKAPVSIDPWKGPFAVGITVFSYTNESSWGVTERIPSEFTVVDSGGATLTSQDGSQSLTWQGLTNGSAVRYSLNAPRRSPELYVLGEVTVHGAGDFREARPWFIVADPGTDVDYLYPDEAAPGMNVVVTFIGPDFDENDTVRTNSSDIFVGPVFILNQSASEVTSGGRTLQTVFFINASAQNQSVTLNISGTLYPNNFSIRTPGLQSGNFSGLSGTRTLGNGGANGTRSFSGTIVLDSLIIPAGMTVNVTTTDPDAALANGHQGYFASVILVDGPVEIAGVLMVNGSDGTNGSGDTGGSA
ncbi:hypothetical protein J4439_04380, partial [Candidatus Woesearchaeota archaeon]|nr:hypothetical protein [Candidatus Woesearchaeota archaeon]